MPQTEASPVAPGAPAAGTPTDRPTEALAARPASPGALTRGDVAVLVASQVIPANTPADVIRFYGRFCAEAQLNPFKRHVHLVKYPTKNGDRYVIQTGIDGYRSLAERTGNYLPGDEPSFVHDKDGKLVSATAYVMRLHGGAYHKIAATAFYAEFVRCNKEGHPDAIWGKMPHAQLAKCAEALALRKAFPDAIGPVYSSTEVRSAEFKQSEQQLAPAPAGSSEAPHTSPEAAEDLQPDDQVEEAQGEEAGSAAAPAADPAPPAIGETKTGEILSAMNAAKSRQEVNQVNQRALELYKAGELTNGQMVEIGRRLNERVKELK